MSDPVVRRGRTTVEGERVAVSRLDAALAPAEICAGVAHEGDDGPTLRRVRDDEPA